MLKVVGGLIPVLVVRLELLEGAYNFFREGLRAIYLEEVVLFDVLVCDGDAVAA